MRTKRLRWAATAAVMVGLVGGAALVAQRGGYRNFTPQSYSANVRYDGKFVFVRMSYPWSGGRGAPWAHDYPAGETHFMKILSTISNLSAHTEETSIMSFSDPEMFKFPVIYLCEPGYWSMSDTDVTNLRNYLQKGGFLIVDDFPDWAWSNFDLQMSRVFPEGRWVDLEPRHPIFHSFFEIDSFDIIPQYYMRGRPVFRAMFEGNDPSKRMQVMVNYNTDISEYWEWSETGIKPIDESNEAYKLGVNEFIYGITH
jgi:Domain of unknown function (DUF4159)